jgi:CMP-N-acetylneuraminic acid synthetase
MINALLPMKGHSERVKNKNLKDFNGAPLYHLILQSLLSTKNIDIVIIDTDSEIIKRDAIDNFNRVAIIDRPLELQGDLVSMNKIIEYDLSKLNGEHFIQTHATNPLLKPDTIDRAINTYFNFLPNYDSLFSVTRLQQRLYMENGTPINHDPKELLRTQDLPLVFEENSNFFIFSKESFKRSGNNRIGVRFKMFELNKLEAMDIDEPEDFILAETLYKLRKAHK